MTTLHDEESVPNDHIISSRPHSSMTSMASSTTAHKDDAPRTSKNVVFRTSDVIAEQVKATVAKSRDGVKQVSQHVMKTSRNQAEQYLSLYMPKWNRESILRFITPFVLLFLWLIVGMVLFYVIESPAEHYRVEAAMSTNQRTVKDEAISNESPMPIKEHNLVVQLQQSAAENSSLDDDTLRAFNSLFSQNQLEIISAKISSISNRFLTLTILYRNRTASTVPTSPETSNQPTTTTIHEDKPENFKWDLPGSLFFCLAVVTTIGYGNLAPYTNVGKFICVIYAIIGIPLFLVVVEQMRQILVRYACKMHKLFYRLAQCFQRNSRTLIQKSVRMVPRRSGSANVQRTVSAAARHEAARNLRIHHNEVRAATGVVAISLSFVIIVLPSIFFVEAEGWDYLTALYFSFISLTTIGFGDVIAGQQSGGTGFGYGVYRLFLCIWLFFGITFVAVLIRIMQTLIERLIELIHWKRRVKERELSRRHRKVETTIQEDEEEQVPMNTMNLLDIIDSDLLCDLKKTKAPPATRPRSNSANAKRSSLTASEISNSSSGGTNESSTVKRLNERRRSSFDHSLIKTIASSPQPADDDNNNEAV